MSVLGIGKYSQRDVYISLLKEGHRGALSGFRSDNRELNEFLARDALEYQRLNLGITYLLFAKDGDRLLSYITLGMGALRLPDEKGRSEFVFRGKKLHEYPKDFPNQFPALLVGKLATAKAEEGRGAASLLLDFAVKNALELRERIGCAYLLTHAYASPPEVMGWYKSRGFKTYVSETKGRETVPMYFEL